MTAEQVRRRRDDRAAREDRAARGGRPRRPDVAWGQDGADPALAPDETLGFLTRTQARRLRELVAAAFAAAGVEVEVDGAVARAPGREFGLEAVAVACLETGRDDPAGDGWPELVRESVGRLLAADGALPLSLLPVQEVVERTYLRLVGLATLPDAALGRLRYGRVLAADLVELLAFDETGDGHANPGGAVRMLQDGDLQGFLPGLLRAAGLRNLLGLPLGEHEVLRGPQGQQVHLVTGPSPFTASKLLVLPDVLPRTLGTGEPPNGLLVAVPYRHQLAFAPVEAASVLEVLEMMVPLAERGFVQGVGAVSPFLYWWRDGRLTQVSVLTDRGTWAVDDTGDFGALLDRLLPG